jgi:hypothetical protein
LFAREPESAILVHAKETMRVYTMKNVKKFLTVFLAGLVLFSLAAYATSVSEFEKMSFDEQNHFLAKETVDLLNKVKAYDPALEQKTRAYMFDETNQWGIVKGEGAVLAVIADAEKKRPDALDKLQVETITKVVMRHYWKDQGITVPKSIFDDKPASTPEKSGNAGQ